FNRLDEVKIGDEIILETEKGTYTYHVTGTKVVAPDEMSVLDPTKDATVTLITCTPLYVATHRLIVTGELVAESIFLDK
ncbi:MAG: sortase, partial [Lachnospiraceae bacterium]|nr:sortase [Lachnospiraceae bacterium]